VKQIRCVELLPDFLKILVSYFVRPKRDLGTSWESASTMQCPNGNWCNISMIAYLKHTAKW